jgi:hypothetical protein
MAIQDLRISIGVDQATLNCGQDVCNVTVIVAITTDGTPSRYAVSVWDYNTLFANTQLTDRVEETIPAMGPTQEYTKVHYFTLECDGSCHVAGNYGSAGESTADVFARGEEWNDILGQPVVGGKSVDTSTVEVSCVSGGEVSRRAAEQQQLEMERVPAEQQGL